MKKSNYTGGLFCASLVMLPATNFAWPTLKSIDNQATATIKITAQGTGAGQKEETLNAGDMKNELYWAIPGAWGGGYIKIEVISGSGTKTYYLQLLQVNDSSPKLATLRTNLQGAPISQLSRDVEDVSIRIYPEPKLFEGIFASKNLILRDGCKNWGDDCICGAGAYEGYAGTKCNTGKCFKGFHYGDESLYCNCTAHNLTDAQIKDLEKVGRKLQTDQACSRKPAWGYDGQGVVELGTKLKKLQDDGLFFKTNGDNARELSRDYGIAIRINQSIDEIVKQVKEEMKSIYGGNVIPNKQLVDLYENEDIDGWKKPCEYFQRILQFKINAATGGKPTYAMSLDVINLINSMCPENPEPKGNFDPCICGNTKKPGICRVNACESLRMQCRCD